MPKSLYLDSAWRMFDRAFSAHHSAPRRTGPTKWEWSISGNCSTPFWRELTFRPDEKQRQAGHIHGLTVHLEARCRKCDDCLRRRAWLWRERAVREVAAATRTWFVTFTVRPDDRYRVLNQCRVELDEQGIDFDRLPSKDQFAEKARVIGAEITNFFKRLRKQTKAPLRYLLVAEAHADGEPHFHALIHETDPLNPVKYRELRQQWGLGFLHAKQVSADEKSAYYVCKYLAKSVLARVRASIRYGNAEEAFKTLFSLGAALAAAVTKKMPLLKQEGKKSSDLLVPQGPPPVCCGDCTHELSGSLSWEQGAEWLSKHGPPKESDSDACKRQSAESAGVTVPG